MHTVSIQDAKSHLSRLVEEASRGESFIIAKAGRPMVKVIPLEGVESGDSRRLGFMSGEIAVPDDFDRMGKDDLAALFEGGS